MTRTGLDGAFYGSPRPNCAFHTWSPSGGLRGRHSPTTSHRTSGPLGAGSALDSVVRRGWSALQFPLDPLLANFLGTATVIYVLFLPLSCFYSLGWFRRNLRTSWFCVSCRYGCIVPIWYAVVCLQAWPYVSLRAMPWYAVLTLRAAVGLLLCLSRSAGFWGSLLCPVNVPGGLRLRVQRV